MAPRGDTNLLIHFLIWKEVSGRFFKALFLKDLLALKLRFTSYKGFKFKSKHVIVILKLIPIVRLNLSDVDSLAIQINADSRTGEII